MSSRNPPRLTESEKSALLAEATQWRACVEQVVFTLATDRQAAPIIAWLMIWLSEPKNVKKTLNLTIAQIIDMGRRAIRESA